MQEYFENLGEEYYENVREGSFTLQLYISTPPNPGEDRYSTSQDSNPLTNLATFFQKFRVWNQFHDIFQYIFLRIFAELI